MAKYLSRCEWIAALDPRAEVTGDLADLSHFDLKDSKGQKKFGGRILSRAI
jgi:hypothetical protein